MKPLLLSAALLFAASVFSHAGNEAADAVRPIGVDYAKMLSKAMQNNGKAAKLFILLPAGMVFDGAVGEAYSIDLTALLKRLGDKTFAKHLDNLSAQQRTHTLDAIEQGTQEDLAHLKQKYPRTVGALTQN